MKKTELFKQIKANVLMYQLKINDSRVVYDLNRNYVKTNKKRDIVRFYLEFGKDETMKQFNLSTRSFYKIIDGIGYVSSYNGLESKYEYMETEDELFGFKCSYEDLSKSEQKIYNSL